MIITKISILVSLLGKEGLMIRKSYIGASKVLAIFYFFVHICFMQFSVYVKLICIAFITRVLRMKRIHPSTM